MKKTNWFIEHSNTDIKKLHNLARNGIFSRATINRILSNTDCEKIYFFSKYAFDKYQEVKFSTFALYHD